MSKAISENALKKHLKSKLGIKNQLKMSVNSFVLILNLFDLITNLKTSFKTNMTRFISLMKYWNVINLQLARQ